MLTLSIPQRRDPIARGVLLVLLGAALYLNVVTLSPPVQAQSDTTTIIYVQPTPALPTADPALAIDVPPVDGAAPALELAAPTPEPWIAPTEPPPVDNSDYLANVGAQEGHSPRGDVAHPPSFTTGDVHDPEINGGDYIVIVATALPSYAVAVPPLSDAQAAVLAERDSNGCASGQVFMPRTGCHTPGSGGAQPGAVGAP